MKTLNGLIENRIFRIPDYQRGYSWEKKHIKELIDDIENIRIQADKSYHFTGIISYSEFSKQEFEAKENILFDDVSAIEVFHVTDGQQRLTTLFILLFECYRNIYGDEVDFQERFINKVLKVKIEDKTIYRFGYDVDVPSREFLYSEIFEDKTFIVTKPATLYTNNLQNAKKYIRDYFENYKDKKGVKAILRKLENKLLFQEFVIDTKKLDVSMVFETMNYRGKSLSKLELFKNRLIYLLSNVVSNTKEEADNVEALRKKITDTWLIVYSWLGKISDFKINDDAFLRAFTIIHFENSKTINSEFKNIIDRLFEIEFPITSQNKTNENLSHDRIEKLLTSMEIIAKSYFVINNPFSEDPEIDDLRLFNQVKRALFILNQVNGAEYMKTLVCAALGNYFSVENRNTDRLLELLIEIEKHQMILFNFLGRKVNANREKIYRVCNSVFEGQINYNQLVNQIHEYTHHWWDRKDSIEFFKNKVESNFNKFFDIDGIKLLLFIKEIEPGKIEISQINDFRIEPIFPDQRGANTKFPNVVRARSPQSIKIIGNSLGNMLLVERRFSNLKIVSSPDYFEHRKKLLSDSKIVKCREISNILGSWSDQNIVERGYEIFNFITNRYQITISDHNIKQLLIEDLIVSNL